MKSYSLLCVSSIFYHAYKAVTSNNLRSNGKVKTSLANNLSPISSISSISKASLRSFDSSDKKVMETKNNRLLLSHQPYNKTTLPLNKLSFLSLNAKKPASSISLEQLAQRSLSLKQEKKNSLATLLRQDHLKLWLCNKTSGTANGKNHLKELAKFNKINKSEIDIFKSDFRVNFSDNYPGPVSLLKNKKKVSRSAKKGKTLKKNNFSRSASVAQPLATKTPTAVATLSLKAKVVEQKKVIPTTPKACFPIIKSTLRSYPILKAKAGSSETNFKLKAGPINIKIKNIIASLNQFSDDTDINNNLRHLQHLRQSGFIISPATQTESISFVASCATLLPKGERGELAALRCANGSEKILAPLAPQPTISPFSPLFNYFNSRNFYDKNGNYKHDYTDSKQTLDFVAQPLIYSDLLKNSNISYIDKQQKISKPSEPVLVAPLVLPSANSEGPKEDLLSPQEKEYLFKEWLQKIEMLKDYNLFKQIKSNLINNYFLNKILIKKFKSNKNFKYEPIFNLNLLPYTYKLYFYSYEVFFKYFLLRGLKGISLPLNILPLIIQYACAASNGILKTFGSSFSLKVNNSTAASADFKEDPNIPLSLSKEKLREASEASFLSLNQEKSASTDLLGKELAAQAAQAHSSLLNNLSGQERGSDKISEAKLFLN